MGSGISGAAKQAPNPNNYTGYALIMLFLDCKPLIVIPSLYSATSCVFCPDFCRGFGCDEETEAFLAAEVPQCRLNLHFYSRKLHLLQPYNSQQNRFL